MKRLFWRLAPEVVLGSFLFGAGGCDPKHDVKPGPPELLGISVIDNATGQSLTTSADGGLVAVPGFVHLSSLFDRLLDTAPLGTFDGGTEFGSDVVSFTVTPALPPGAVTYTSFYSPNGGPVELAPGVSGGLLFGPGPTIASLADPTFPSNSTITATLDRTRIRSKKGEPFIGDAALMFQTLPFAAAIAVPMGDPDPDAGADAGPPPVPAAMQSVTLTFNNIPVTGIASHVTVTAGGAPFTAFTVDADPNMNPTLFTVTPTATWPANTTIEVTVDATAADPFGNTLGAATSSSFTTGNTAP